MMEPFGSLDPVIFIFVNVSTRLQPSPVSNSLIGVSNEYTSCVAPSSNSMMYDSVSKSKNTVPVPFGDNVSGNSILPPREQLTSGSGFNPIPDRMDQGPYTSSFSSVYVINQFREITSSLHLIQEVKLTLGSKQICVGPSVQTDKHPVFLNEFSQRVQNGRIGPQFLFSLYVSAIDIKSIVCQRYKLNCRPV